MKNDKQCKRKWYFRFLKKIMKVRYKKPNFIFLGDMPQNSSLIISNHEGTDAPMSLEIYLNAPLRFWGAHEMNSGFVKMYKYQTRVYYHEKKHWNLHLARLFCLVATPLTYLFYSGLDLISTYKDGRAKNTMKQSLEALDKGQNIVVFPEDSTKGYLETLESFYQGFVLLCEIAMKKGRDIPIYVSYFRKKDKTYIFDKPILFSTLQKKNLTREEMANYLLERCNKLGQMTINAEQKVEISKVNA